MQNRRRIIASVSVATVAAVTVGVVVGHALSGGQATTDPSPTSSTGSLQAGAPNAPTGSPSGTSEGRAGTTSDGSGSPSPTPSGKSAGSTRGGVEVIPEIPGSTPTSLPGLTATTTELPDWEDLGDESVSARGRLVAGYPSRLLPVTPRATIVSSSLSPSPERVQVALVARRDQSPATVLRFYRSALAKAGFKERPATGVGGASTAAFTRDSNSVVITVDPGSAGTYTVFANLAKSKA